MGETTNTNLISSKLLVYGRNDKYQFNIFQAACLWEKRQMDKYQFNIFQAACLWEKRQIPI
jgi:hypothetical protein